MRKSFVKLICLTSIAVAACMPAMSAPSGLNVIPTADVLDKSAISLEAELDGTGHPWGGDCDSFALFQIGIGNGIELGVDKCTSDSDSWLNFKWRLRDEDDILPAFAVGTQGVSEKDHAQPFAVATKSLGKSRAHIGLIGIEHKTRCMFGLDYHLSDKMTFQTDYINGDENTTGFGIAVNLTQSVSINLARLIGNSDDVGDGYMVNVAYSIPLK